MAMHCSDFEKDHPQALHHMSERICHQGGIRPKRSVWRVHRDGRRTRDVLLMLPPGEMLMEGRQECCLERLSVSRSMEDKLAKLKKTLLNEDVYEVH